MTDDERHALIKRLTYEQVCPGCTTPGMMDIITEKPALMLICHSCGGTWWAEPKYDKEDNKIHVSTVLFKEKYLD